jgi:hypothetical protein
MNDLDNDNIHDTSSPEYLERPKAHEAFQARLSKMFADTGIIEVKNHDDNNDSPETDTYTISFNNGVKKKQSSEPQD